MTDLGASESPMSDRPMADATRQIARPLQEGRVSPSLQPQPPAVARCRLCGDETKVSKGIWKLRSGKFVDILRCVDHAACEQRRAAI